jgi:hypothetical protein
MHNVKVHHKKLTRRLRYLWTFELFDSFLFPAFVAWSSRYLQQPVGILAIYSTGLVTFLLWQGAAYWSLKLRAHRTGVPIPRRYLARFRTLRVVNWVLIGLLPVILVITGALGLSVQSRLNLVAGAALYALAVLEQVNYYHYQLMYDYGPDWRYLLKHRRFKRSSLSRALARARRGGKPADATKEQRNNR